MCRLVNQKRGTWLGGRLSTPKRVFRVAGSSAGPCPKAALPGPCSEWLRGAPKRSWVGPRPDFLESHARA